MLSIKNSHGWVLIDNSMDEIYDNEEFQKLIANFGAAYQALQNTDIDHPFIKGIVRLIDWYYNHFLNDEDHAQIIFNPIYKNNGDGLEFEDVTIYSDEVDKFMWEHPLDHVGAEFLDLIRGTGIKIQAWKVKDNGILEHISAKRNCSFSWHHKNKYGLKKKTYGKIK